MPPFLPPQLLPMPLGGPDSQEARGAARGRVQSRLGYQPDASGGYLPAVVSSSADNILVVMGETDVRHVS